MGHMPRSQPEPAPAPAAADAADAAEILRAITRIGYLITRARRHDTVRAGAAGPLDRAAVMVLGHRAEAGPVQRHRGHGPDGVMAAGPGDQVADPSDRPQDLGGIRGIRCGRGGGRFWLASGHVTHLTLLT